MTSPINPLSGWFVESFGFHQPDQTTEPNQPSFLKRCVDTYRDFAQSQVWAREHIYFIDGTNPYEAAAKKEVERVRAALTTYEASLLYEAHQHIQAKPDLKDQWVRSTPEKRLALFQSIADWFSDRDQIDKLTLEYKPGLKTYKYDWVQNKLAVGEIVEGGATIHEAPRFGNSIGDLMGGMWEHHQTNHMVNGVPVLRELRQQGQIKPAVDLFDREFGQGWPDAAVEERAQKLRDWLGHPELPASLKQAAQQAEDAKGLYDPEQIHTVIGIRRNDPGRAIRVFLLGATNTRNSMPASLLDWQNMLLPALHQKDTFREWLGYNFAFQHRWNSGDNIILHSGLNRDKVRELFYKSYHGWISDQQGHNVMDQVTSSLASLANPASAVNAQNLDQYEWGYRKHKGAEMIDKVIKQRDHVMGPMAEYRIGTGVFWLLDMASTIGTLADPYTSQKEGQLTVTALGASTVGMVLFYTSAFVRNGFLLSRLGGVLSGLSAPLFSLAQTQHVFDQSESTISEKVWNLMEAATGFTFLASYFLFHYYPVSRILANIATASTFANILVNYPKEWTREKRITAGLLKEINNPSVDTKNLARLIRETDDEVARAVMEQLEKEQKLDQLTKLPSTAIEALISALDDIWTTGDDKKHIAILEKYI